ncbi:MAG: Rhs family protein [Fibrobacteres bacterium]|nr:Rhs family protein [Fibrobacterota bacterium]
MDARLAEVLQLLRDKTLSPLSPQGPPPRPSEQCPITWLFEPDSFAPLARLQGERRESIVCDHLGTPLAMFNDSGEQTWSLDLDIYGQPRMVEGERTLCPFRYPGQYEDAETGLYYNCFRYFDPEAGGYISQDPIRLEGGNPTLYGYVGDPGWQFDPLGLRSGKGRTHVTYTGKKNGKDYSGYASAPTSLGLTPEQIVDRRYSGNYDQFSEKPVVRYSGEGVKGKDTARGLEQHYYEHSVKKRGRDNVANGQNPVGPRNKKRDRYRNAAEEHNRPKKRKKKCGGS